MRNDYYEAPWKRLGPVQSPALPEPPAGSPRTPVTEEDKVRRTPYVRQRTSGRRQGRRRSGVLGFLLFFALILGMTGSIFAVRELPLFQLPGGQDRWFPGGDTPWGFGGDGSDGDQWHFGQDDWVDLLEKTSIRSFPAGAQVTLELCPESGETLAPVEIYEKVNPSIVGVRTTGTLGISTGTGIILTSDGYIVTNAHVIAGGQRADVLFPNNALVAASLVGYDRETDLAVLKVKAADLPAVRFGDSSVLRVGEPAYAIGNPLGEELRGTMTDGIISAIDRSVSARNGSMSLIQTTAALNPGNSGGALVNAAGEVIGITNMKMMSEEETIEGLGFAIPSTLVKDVAEQIISTGRYAGAPMLGVTVQNHFDEDNTPDGAQVVSVEPGLGAELAGVLPGEVIVSANATAVTCVDDLLKAKQGLKLGEELVLELRSGEDVRTVTVIMMSTRQAEEG